MLEFQYPFLLVEKLSGVKKQRNFALVISNLILANVPSYGYMVSMMLM